jgi:Zn finger protein HypA/HybF involved in hydrogenase expression
MSLVLCPACSKQGFLWHIDDDNRTWWDCVYCKFNVEEDERKEKLCPECGKQSTTGSSKTTLDITGARHAVLDPRDV